MTRRIVTARDQVEMLAPWLHHHHHAFRKEARYPQEWRSHAPYGYLPSGRARNRPPSVLRDPENPDEGIIDPSEIIYKRRGDSVSAFHPNGDHLGNYSWDDGSTGNHPHIEMAQVNPLYQGQGVSGAIIDHIREHHEPDLAHSGYQGVGSLSYQGRAGALRDLGNTEKEHNDYFNTKPYNYGESSPSRFYVTNPDTGRRDLFDVTEAQRKAHLELMKQFEEDRLHPNYIGSTSSGGRGDPDMRDEYGALHEYGYDPDGNYVGLSSGTKDSEGYSEEGYNSSGYDREGYNREGYDSENRDEYGFHRETGLNRDGKTRHGYTPGDGTPPEGTVPMSEMASHWAQHGLPTSSEHQSMMDGTAGGYSAPTMYAVRSPGEVSPNSGHHHVGNGDTLYSSLERARQVAYHPDDPSKDKNIVSVTNLDPDYLHTDASGANPEDFHYAPDSSGLRGDDVADTTSTKAELVHDPHRHQRILGDLGHGWSQSTEPPLSHNSGFEYTDPSSGRSGRMYQKSSDGTWRTQHQPQFGGQRVGAHQTYRDAAEAIREGTKPGPTMDIHALELNNNYQTTGGGEVDWEPHPGGQGLTARTPHGDLHLVQDPSTGRWNHHIGPHGTQPGDDGVRSSMLPDNRDRAAQMGIQAITENPFHGGLADELGEGWGPHPTSRGAFTRRLPSGNHAFVRKNVDGKYISGIQVDTVSGQPAYPPRYMRVSPNLDQAKAFIQHRESPVPASDLGEGWEDFDIGSRDFPTYLHENHHPTGAVANIAWDIEQGGWKPTVHVNGGQYPGIAFKTPHLAAVWATRMMDSFK